MAQVLTLQTKAKYAELLRLIIQRKNEYDAAYVQGRHDTAGACLMALGSAIEAAERIVNGR
jgi:hypothetical protein